MYFWYLKGAVEVAKSWVQTAQNGAIQKNIYSVLHPSSLLAQLDGAEQHESGSQISN
jgi:hypothetical protein